MADEEIQKLRRVAERSGPTPFLLGLCDPDAGELLRVIGRDGRRTLRAMLQYVDSLETWTIECVDRRRWGPARLRVGARTEAGALRCHALQWWSRPSTPNKERSNATYTRFMEAMKEQGADPARPETWIGKQVAGSYREQPVPETCQDRPSHPETCQDRPSHNSRGASAFWPIAQLTVCARSVLPEPSAVTREACGRGTLRGLLVQAA